MPRALCAAVLVLGLMGGPVGAQAQSGSPTGVPAGNYRTIVIRAYAFTVPKDVTPGTLVQVIDMHSQSHTVTATLKHCRGGRDASAHRCFDVSVRPGETVYFKAPSQPGSYDFLCRYHHSMRGVLVVK